MSDLDEVRLFCETEAFLAVAHLMALEHILERREKKSPKRPPSPRILAIRAWVLQQQEAARWLGGAA